MIWAQRGLDAMDAGSGRGGIVRGDHLLSGPSLITLSPLKWRKNDRLCRKVSGSQSFTFKCCVCMQAVAFSPTIFGNLTRERRSFILMSFSEYKTESPSLCASRHVARSCDVAGTFSIVCPRSGREGSMGMTLSGLSSTKQER